MKILNMIKRLLTAPKHIFLDCLELILLAVIAEAFCLCKRDQLTYFQLLLTIIAIISITNLIIYFHKHCLERDWDIVYKLDKTKQQL